MIDRASGPRPPSLSPSRGSECPSLELPAVGQLPGGSVSCHSPAEVKAARRGALHKPGSKG